MGLVGNIRDASPNDRGIHLGSFNAAMQSSRKMGRIRFDPKFFRWTGGDESLFVTLNDLPEDIPMDKRSFGIVRESLNIFEIQYGYIWQGDRDPILPSNGDGEGNVQLTVSVDQSVFYVEYDFDAHTCEVLNNGAAWPAATGTTVVWPLYVMSYNTTTQFSEVDRYLWLGGDIHLPGTFATTTPP